MTCGIVHPAIILSGDAHTWNDDDLNRALVHELEHVRRADWASHCLARVVCALYWFHPLVWIAWRRLVLEAERACDDAVLARSEATAYAEQLVGLAQRLSAASKLPLTAMASRADLAARIGAVLDHRLRRGRAGRLAVALACAAATVLVGVMSPLTMVAAPQTAEAPIGRFAVRTGLVIVTATVTDSNGLPIEGLTINDLLVTEDGVPQKITVFDFQRAPAGAPNSPTSYYVLGYYANPNGDGKFRKIEVTRRGDPSARLNFRAGYTVAAPPPPNPAPAPQAVARRAAFDGTVPQLILKIEPEYTEEARKAKYQGTVLLSVEIDDTGHVTDAKIVRQLGLGLDQKAIDAVKRWRFKPATKNGQPVTMWTEVEVSFRLL
jgi:TonB family protein